MIPAKEGTPGPRGMDLARAMAIFLFVFAVYFVGYARTLPPTADEMIDFGLAQSMAKWQIFSIDQVSTVGPNPEEFGIDGHRYSKYGPLQAVLSVPLFWLAQRQPIGAVDTVLLLNHLVTAASMALLFLLVRRLGYGPVVALGITALVAFGTPLWIHSKRFLGEPTITLCVIATIYSAYVAATTRRPLWLVLTGLAFGAAVASKYVNGVLLLPVPLYLAWTAGFPHHLPPLPAAGEGSSAIALLQSPLSRALG
ncbi:MAG: ArnT family glycosyltransferase, partial [Chloroflexota bacterium]